MAQNNKIPYINNPGGVFLTLFSGYPGQLNSDEPEGDIYRLTDLKPDQVILRKIRVIL
jgi:hypothetical protein